MNDSSTRHIFTVLGLALLLLLGASVLPWSTLTDNRIKDFRLWEDLFPRDDESRQLMADNSSVDPELLVLEQEMSEQAGDIVPADTLENDMVAWIPPMTEAPRCEGHVVIENYSAEPALARFKSALAQADSRPVRIAVVGDSFIEGDIFTQDLRRLLQERYGGAGVGYLCIHSDLPGFRRTVRQSCSGWKLHNILNQGRSDTIRNFSSEFAVSQDNASTTFNGTNFSAGTAAWSRSKAVFIARDTASVTLEIDGESRVFTLEPSARPQSIELDGNTTSLKIKDLTPGLLSLGVYLDGATGVSVDCISNRGSSGLNLRQVKARNAQAVAYDLIILEFGINALTAEQTNYASYTIGIRKSIEHLKELFPDADILLMGIADRGSKVNGVVKSLPTCNAMTDAQRKAAHETGICFYDIRAAQGGENAVVDWRSRGLVNADYIHLNHKGGAALAEEFVTGLLLSLEPNTLSSNELP